MSKNEDKTAIVKQRNDLTKSEKNLISEWQSRKNAAKIHFYFEKKKEGFLEIVRLKYMKYFKKNTVKKI